MRTVTKGFIKPAIKSKSALRISLRVFKFQIFFGGACPQTPQVGCCLMPTAKFYRYGNCSLFLQEPRKGGNEEAKGVGKALTAWAMASTAVPMRCSLIPCSEVWEDKEDSMESGDLPPSKC